jgi:hypothetical protein
VTGRDAATWTTSSAAGTPRWPCRRRDGPGGGLRAVRRARDELGTVDLLVANAGSFAAGGRLWETDPDLWWRDVEVNLRGPALSLHAVLPGDGGAP